MGTGDTLRKVASSATASGPLPLPPLPTPTPTHTLLPHHPLPPWKLKLPIPQLRWLGPCSVDPAAPRHHRSSHALAFLPCHTAPATCQAPPTFLPREGSSPPHPPDRPHLTNVLVRHGKAAPRRGCPARGQGLTESLTPMPRQGHRARSGPAAWPRVTSQPGSLASPDTLADSRLGRHANTSPGTRQAPKHYYPSPLCGDKASSL